MMNNMKWIIPKPRGQEIFIGRDESVSTSDFNAPLPENYGGVCIAEPHLEIKGDRSVADDDIRNGNIKSFDSTDDLLASLKQPW